MEMVNGNGLSELRLFQNYAMPLFAELFAFYFS